VKASEIYRTEMEIALDVGLFLTNSAFEEAHSAAHTKAVNHLLSVPNLSRMDKRNDVQDALEEMVTEMKVWWHRRLRELFETAKCRVRPNHKKLFRS